MCTFWPFHGLGGLLRPLSLRRPVFDPRIVQVVYVGEQTGTGTCFSPSTCGFPVSLSFHGDASCISREVFFCDAATQRGSWPPHSWGFLDHSERRTTVGRTPLDEWSARRRDLYLTTHNTHNRQTSMAPVGFEPTISADEWPPTYALNRAATGTGCRQLIPSLNQ